MAEDAKQVSENEYEVKVETSSDFVSQIPRQAEAYVSAWSAARECFGTGPVTFYADWGGIAEKELESHATTVRFYSAMGSDEFHRICVELENAPAPPPAAILVRVRGGKGSLSYAEDLVRMYFMNCFLALNLSAPGCSSMFATFQSKQVPKEVKLWGSNWFFTWDMIWPVIQGVPLAETQKWVTDVGFGKGQLAETPVQRLLVTLLRVSDGELWGPEHVLWLSQALEGMVDSPVDRITNTLHQRLVALLGAPRSVAATKRQVGKFYALRSRIAHGNFQFVHPIGNELIDPRIDAIYDELHGAVGFGMSAAVAVAQALVFRGWRSVSFVEDVRGTT